MDSDYKHIIRICSRLAKRKLPQRGARDIVRRDTWAFKAMTDSYRLGRYSREQGRRPRIKKIKNQLIKPRHLTQRHKFPTLENRINSLVHLFPRKNKTSAPVYQFKKNYAAPGPSSIYSGNFPSGKEYLGFFAEEEKPEPKPKKEEPAPKTAQPKDISYKFENHLEAA